MKKGADEAILAMVLGPAKKRPEASGSSRTFGRPLGGAKRGMGESGLGRGLSGDELSDEEEADTEVDDLDPREGLVSDLQRALDRRDAAGVYDVIEAIVSDRVRNSME
jgi:hypothetical protein